MRFLFTPEAEHDMDYIAAYLQSLPRVPALRIGKDIQEAIRMVVRFPDLGKVDEKLTRRSAIKVLRLVAGQYILFYYVAGDFIRIIGVLHGRRDIARIVSDRLE